jgi:hypothetical protein
VQISLLISLLAGNLGAETGLREIDWLRGIVTESASAGANGRTRSNGRHGSRHLPEHHDQSAQAATHLRRNGGST